MIFDAGAVGITIQKREHVLCTRVAPNHRALPISNTVAVTVATTTCELTPKMRNHYQTFCLLLYQSQPKVVTDTDEAELARHLTELEKQNMEVDGDNDADDLGEQ